MKKLLALLLVAVMCLFLAACGSKEDYSGKWVAEWTVTETNNIVSKTLELYEDGTFKETTTSSANGYEEFQGTWKVKGNEIKLEFTKLVEGEHICFDTNGQLIDGMELHRTYEIIDTITIKNGDHYYDKEH